MVKTQVGGISGVLGELISKEPEDTEPEAEKQPPASRQKADPTGTPKTPAAPHSQRARLGRPPGTSTRQTGPKEKVTLRISSDLIAEYRDWSWEARCQLSELVERCLPATGNRGVVNVR